MRVLNASDEPGSGGHSHSHSHHHHAPVEAASSALDIKSANSEGLRQRKEKSEEVVTVVEEKKGKEVSASLRLSAYLNLFGDFSKHRSFMQVVSESDLTCPSLAHNITDGLVSLSC